jgi:hypothetical protein
MGTTLQEAAFVLAGRGIGDLNLKIKQSLPFSFSFSASLFLSLSNFTGYYLQFLFLPNIIGLFYPLLGQEIASLVEALCYNPEGYGFDS